MRQRTALARPRQRSQDPAPLDEPFGALDTQTRGLMQELLLGAVLVHE
jgi:ABC-type nitrate/sulfonate/bicarbonate transport system ATPase subunit